MRLFLGLIDDRAGPVLRVGEDLGGRGRRRFAQRTRLGLGAGFQRLRLLTLLAGTLDGLRKLALGFVQVLLGLGDRLLLAGEELLLGLVASRLELDVEVDAGLFGLARDSAAGFLRLEGELGAHRLVVVLQGRAHLRDLACGIRSQLARLGRGRLQRRGELGLKRGTARGDLELELGACPGGLLLELGASPGGLLLEFGAQPCRVFCECAACGGRLVLESRAGL